MVMAMTITQSRSFRTGLFFTRPDAFKLYYKYNQMGQAKQSTFTNHSEKGPDGLLLCIRVGSSGALGIHLFSLSGSSTPWEGPCCLLENRRVEDEAHIFPSVIKPVVLCLPETIEKVGINPSRSALLHLHITQLRLRPLDSFTGKVSQEPETG